MRVGHGVSVVLQNECFRLPCVSFRENPISVGFPSFAPYGAKFTLSCVFYTVRGVAVCGRRDARTRSGALPLVPTTFLKKGRSKTFCQFFSSFSFLFAYFLFFKRMRFYTARENVRSQKTTVKSIINTYPFCSSFSFLFAYLFLFQKKK